MSQWFLVSLIIINIWWDVYHSSLQTFGFARIYDALAGNMGKSSRNWDYGMNLVIYMGPLLSGALFMDHVGELHQFSSVGSALLTSIPFYISTKTRLISLIVSGFSIVFMLMYVMAYYRLYKKGYSVSIQKIVLMVSTLICSIFAWGFNGFGMGFVIMNFFHATQYFAIIYWYEKDTIIQKFRLRNIPFPQIGGLRWSSNSLQNF